MKKIALIIIIFSNNILFSQQNRYLNDEEMEIMTSGDCERTIPLIDKLIKEDSKAHDLYHIKCLCLSSKDESKAALENCNKAIALNPTKAEYFETRGDVYSDLDNYYQAIANYDMAINFGGDNDAIIFSRGEANDEIENVDEALKDYNLAIKLNPNEGEYYASRASLVAANFKNPKLVIEDCNKALLLGSITEKEILQGFRGLAFLDLKKYEKAISDFNVVTSAQWIPSQFRGYYYISRAKAYYHLDDLNAAKSDIDIGIQMNPNFGDGIRYLNLINEGMNNKKKINAEEEELKKRNKQQEIQEQEYKRKQDSIERSLELKHKRKMDSIERIKKLENQRQLDSIKNATPNIEINQTNIGEQTINEDNSIEITQPIQKEEHDSIFDNLIKIIGLLGVILGIFVAIKTLRRKDDSA